MKRCSKGNEGKTKMIPAHRAIVLVLSFCAHSWTAASQVALSTVGYTNIGTALDVQVSDHYAYLANGGSGLRVCDISNPTNPVSAGQAASSGYPRSVAVVGKYAYLGIDGGFDIFDVSNPGSPIKTGSAYFSGSANTIIARSNFAYVLNGVYDVSNPSNPTKVGPNPGFGGFNSVSWGNYIYGTAANSSPTLWISDLTVPASPTNIYSSGFGYLWGVAVSGRYLYAASQSFTLAGQVRQGVLAFDISDPAHPVYISSTSNYIRAGACLVVSGKYAYLAHDTLMVYDISNPTNMVLAGQMGGLGNTFGLSVAGNYAYATTAAGLLVIAIKPQLTLSQPDAPHILLSWPAIAPFALQATTNLTSGSWAAITNSPTEEGAGAKVLLQKPSTNVYFRLVSE